MDLTTDFDDIVVLLWFEGKKYRSLSGVNSSGLRGGFVDGGLGEQDFDHQ
jgi:hypothetical protein